MGRRRELLKAVLEAPERDAPRLAYAAWLEKQRREFDQAQAALIRVQCELARKPSEARRWELERQEQELLGAFGDAWEAELPAGITAEGFHRGFIEAVMATGEDFLAHGQELVERIPLRRLKLGGIDARHLAWLLELDATRRLRELDLGNDGFAEDNHLGLKGAQVLARARNLSRLQALSLQGNGMGEAGISALVGSAPLSRLVHLEVRSNQLGPAGVRSLVTSALGARLRVLFLDGNGLGSEGAAALASPGQLLRLVELGVCDNGLSSLDAKGVVESPALQRVRRLWLSGNPLAQGFSRFVTARTLDRMRELGLARCGLGAIGSRLLAGWSALPHLRYLYLSENGIGDGGVQALAGARRMGRLRELMLSGNGIGVEGARALATSPLARQLRNLELGGNALGPEGAWALATSRLLGPLRELDVSNNQLGDAGALAIADAPWKSLMRLSIHDNGLGPESRERLAKMPSLLSVLF